MSDFNIYDVKWSFLSSERKGYVYLHCDDVEINFEQRTDHVAIREEDSIALAKHFDHYSDPSAIPKLVEAIELIASCESTIEGDCISIAQKALKEYKNE